MVETHIYKIIDSIIKINCVTTCPPKAEISTQRVRVQGMTCTRNIGFVCMREKRAQEITICYKKDSLWLFNKYVSGFVGRRDLLFSHYNGVILVTGGVKDNMSYEPMTS